MAQVSLQVMDEGLDHAGLADYAGQLQQFLRSADLDTSLAYSVEAPPDGARSGGALEVGVVLLQTAVETGALKYAVDLVRDWLGRTEVGDVAITLGDQKLSVKSATHQQRQQIIDHFIAVTSKTD